MPEDDSGQSDEKVYSSYSEIPAVTSGDSILFNRGHTPVIESNFPQLVQDPKVEIHKIISESGRIDRVLTSPADAVIGALELSKDEDPHKIEVVIQMLEEELKQGKDISSPVKSVEFYKDAKEDPESYDMDEEEANQEYEGGRRSLESGIIWIPKQLLAAHKLLTDPRFDRLMIEYIDTHGSDTRYDNGVPTSETHGVFLKRNLRGIRESLIKLSDSFTNLSRKHADLLEAEGVNPPDPEDELKVTQLREQLSKVAEPA